MESGNLNAESQSHAPLRLLSLDGGGVRGLSSLMILKDLMDSIAAEERRLGKRGPKDHSDLKPCDYFDLIGGTSTGGLIAVLLGRLQLDVPKCIELYSKLSEQIFKNDRCIQVMGMKLPTGKTRFSGNVLERAIKSTLKELGYSEDETMWDASLFEETPDEYDRRGSIWSDVVTPAPVVESPTVSQASSFAKGSVSPFVPINRPNQVNGGASSNGNVNANAIKPIGRTPTWKLHRSTTVHKKPLEKGCHAFVVTALKNALGIPRLFTTFDANDHETRIWEALRATSAAPTFFEEMTFGHPIRMTYLDGGLGFNNPCAEVDYTAKSLWEGRSIGIVISIGTGLQTIPSVKKAPWTPFGLGAEVSVAAALAGMATSTARVDNEIQRKYYGTDTKYYRFDVDAGLESVSLEQWMKEDEMGTLTERYMRDPEQVRRSKTLAETMVHLSAISMPVDIAPRGFRTGVDGNGLVHRDPVYPNIPCWLYEELDFKTGFPIGIQVPPTQIAEMESLRSTSPSGRPGLAVGGDGRVRHILPVAEDLDGDGKKQEASVITCIREDNICLRALKTGIPQGKYQVKFVISFFDLLSSKDKSTDNANARCFPEVPPNMPEGTFEQDEMTTMRLSNTSTAAGSTPQVEPPIGLIFSAGKPYHPETFMSRRMDVYITKDIVPALLYPHAVRVRISSQTYANKKGKGWFDLEGDVDVDVGLDGNLGIVISKRFKKGHFIGGWSFGGLRLIPRFGNST